jgi:TonB-dependent SusC/RagA subfamily outer membrane receptor
MGAMPGLQVTGTSGQPGAEMSFNIRGVNSINEGAPLVLVDNVEMDINMLDPNDIESISVLKDAASSAIYGARAAFGVILVTTKKGIKCCLCLSPNKHGKMIFSYGVIRQYPPVCFCLGSLLSVHFSSI